MLSSSAPGSICADRKRVSQLTPYHGSLMIPLQSTVAMARSMMRLLETGLSWEFAMPSIVSSPAPPGISSDCICAVRSSVDDGDSLLVSVIGVYMPCSDQGLECYRDHLIELERVISESSLLGPVVVLGDFNACTFKAWFTGGSEGTG